MRVAGVTCAGTDDSVDASVMSGQIDRTLCHNGNFERSFSVVNPVHGVVRVNWKDTLLPGYLLRRSRTARQKFPI